MFIYGKDIPLENVVKFEGGGEPADIQEAGEASAFPFDYMKEIPLDGLTK
ncbi:hypothetical protein [Bacillus sp. T33-2]|nr:hypothetical protein [Bacillus sp. T33-2]